MKKTSKIVAILCMVLMILSINVSNTMATDTGSLISRMGDNGNVSTGEIETIGKNIATIIRTVGTIISVVILLILGIKYMMGSAEEKADYKKSMIPYIVGAVILFAASTIAGYVLNLANTIGS